MIINSSFESGVFPFALKHAVVTPMIKKQCKDSNAIATYRPVSNIPFLSKIIERLAASRINNYLQVTHQLESNQFAYKRYHSCETAILTLLNFVFHAIDDNKVTVLVLLDLSAAFDTVNHTILLSQLSSLGVGGTAVNWFRSYLTSRTLSVTCKGAFSLATALKCGVPQGSVLGPLLFSLYISPIGSIIRSHGIDFIMYADDIQLFASASVSSVNSVIFRLEACIVDVINWLTTHHLVINASKTELIILGSKPSLKRVQDISISVSGDKILPSSVVRNLGVYIDSCLSMDDHVSRTVRAAFAYLRIISQQASYLDTPSLTLLIHAFVFTRIDFCASTFYGITKKNLAKMQRILNYAARLILHLPRLSSTSTALTELRWLNIEQRIAHHLLNIAFTALSTGSPKSLADALQLASTSQSSTILTRRSADTLLLTHNRTRTKLGDRAFSIAASALWNDLPLNIREKKSRETFRNACSDFLLN
jgi:hypothetical protein